MCLILKEFYITSKSSQTSLLPARLSFHFYPGFYQLIQAQGSLKVQADVIELLMWDETVKQNLVKWPSAASPGSGFALRSRHGRIYSLYAGSELECERWLAALRIVGANMRFSEATYAHLEKMAPEMNAWLNHKPRLPQNEETTSKQEKGEDLYVHKVVGGVVIKTENK
eukprot:m.165766 g.165766  ORF g.165766 m.165766 type:complete len:169 (-) comp15266_c0_seq5:2679-3185(-)